MMTLAIILMIVGYVAIEKDFFVFTDLQGNGKLAMTYLVTIIAMWYLGCLMLFVSGALILIRRKDYYFKYPDRPLSSKL